MATSASDPAAFRAPATADRAEQGAVTTRTPELPWERAYARFLAASDLVVITIATVLAQVLRFGVSSDETIQVSSRLGLNLSYSIISIGVIFAWFAMISIFHTRAARVIGSGNEEYRLVAQATLWFFGLAAIVLFVTKTDIARAYVLVALPLGMVLLVLERWLWRKWLTRQRRAGEYAYRALIVGSRATVQRIAAELSGSGRAAGYAIMGAVIPGHDPSVAERAERDEAPDPDNFAFPITSDLDTVLERMAELGADTLVLGTSERLTSRRVRELSWGLEPGRQHLVMVPTLADVGGPRIHTRPVAGLSLMHVETPQYEGAQAFIKRTFDIVASGLLIVVASIPMAVIAVLVKATSPGPVLYRAERIGYNGRPFHMLKFRSMRDGANAELQRLLEEQGTSDRPLFKVQNDPRITPLGRFLRRYSLDELPQFFNVLGGTMSLIGPRPQVAAEVALYDSAAHRRLLLKPGVTGLWQVSGRSNLSWEEAIRMDLYYVENWSLFSDLVILWRTTRAVLAKDGAL